MNQCLIYHHLGLGDHIICVGLVREIIKRYDIVGLVVKPHNVDSVKNFFSDIPIFYVMGDDSFGKQLVANTKLDVCLAGNCIVNKPIKNSFDKHFYDCVGLDPALRFANFEVCRSYGKEEGLFDKFNVKLFEYQVLVEDPKRGFVIDRNKINSNLPIISIDKWYSSNILDYCYLLNHAKELHLIESSFAFLVDYVNEFCGERAVLHRYCRKLDWFNTPEYQMDWEII